MDLVGTVGDAESTRGGVHRSQRNVLAHTRSPVHLDRVVDDLTGDPRCDDLDGRDLGRCLSRSDGVDEPRGLEDQQPRLLDRDARLGNLALDHPVLGERTAEGDSAARASNHE